MSISDTDVKQVFQGNGSTTTFAINFDFETTAEIRVVLRDEGTTPATETVQVVTTNFTLTGGPPVTNVEMITAPSITEKLLVIRLNPLTQPQDFQSTGNFNPQNAEEGLDKLTRIVQELDTKLERAPKLAETTPLDDLVLPEPEAAKLLAWNTAETALENKTTAELGSPIATFTGDLAIKTDSTGAPIDSIVTATELERLTGITDNVQEQIDDAAGSGGGSIEILEGSPAPLEVVDQDMVELEFSADLDQIINIPFIVGPNMDATDKDIQIEFLFSTPATTNDTIFSAAVSLFTTGSGVRDTPSDTETFTKTVTSNGVANTIVLVTFKLTNGSGQVDVTSVIAGDLMRIELRRDSDSGSDTNTSVARIIKGSIILKVVDQ